jgi:hypothetical protein
MPPLNPAEIAGQLDTLIASYNEMNSRSQYDDISDIPIYAREELSSRLYAALLRLAPASSPYVEQAKEASPSILVRIPQLVGLVRALKADVEAGWLVTVQEVLHADTFADFLGQAMELREKGYKDAAAVVAGSVLEAHLRLLCAKFDVSTVASGGGPKKATVLNADLVKATAYNTIDQKAIDAWQAIRNAAAHGEYEKYNDAGVETMLMGIAAFISANPA